MNKTNTFLLIGSIVILVLAIINFSFNLDFMKNLTGSATDTGDVNLTLDAGASISFNVSELNWGQGSVNETYGFAWLVSNGTMLYGTSFNTVTQGLKIQNDGNVNVTVNLSANNYNATFIGGNEPVYKWKVSNNESDSCAAGTIGVSGFTNVPNAAQSRACTNLSSIDTRDSLNVDIELHVPEDATAEAKGSIITATATGVS